MDKNTSKRFEILCEAEQLIKQLAEPHPVKDSIKTAIKRVAAKLGWHPSRAKEIWYRRARRIDAVEIDALRQAARKAAVRYAHIASEMEKSDPDFYREDIAALVGAAHRLSGMDMSGDGKA